MFPLKTVHAAVMWIKTQGLVRFVDWCPTGMKKLV